MISPSAGGNIAKHSRLGPCRALPDSKSLRRNYLQVEGVSYHCFFILIMDRSASKPVVCPRLVTISLPYRAFRLCCRLAAHWYCLSRFLSLVECEFLTLHLLRITFVTYSRSYPNLFCLGLCFSTHSKFSLQLPTIERQRPARGSNRCRLCRACNLRAIESLTPTEGRCCPPATLLMLFSFFFLI